MEKIRVCFCLLILISMFAAIAFFFVKKDSSFEVLKVINAAEFFVDFNKNKICDEDEHIILYDLNIEDDTFSKIDNARLNYLSYLYAKEVLSANKVRVKKDENNELCFILSDGSDYKKNLVKYGYVFTNKNPDILNKNIEYAKKLSLVSFNRNTQRVHKLHCKHAFSSMNYEIIKEEDIPKHALPCKLCHISTSVPHKKKSIFAYPKDVYEKYKPIYKDEFIEFYVTDFTKYYYPSSKCLTTACQSLLNEINNAKTSIDFAVYGIDNQPEITNALLNAHKRGVNIRWVYDLDRKGKTIYSETSELKKYLRNVRSDIELSSEYVNDAIMHNKFFIFDSKRVWTGSANISHTDLSGFNANSVVLINSIKIAQVYKNEFEQMYSGKFHKLKKTTAPNKTLLGSSEVQVYFSPQDSSIEKNIIPLINNAQRYVYIPVFVITHRGFNQALIAAKKRGVDVRIIADATAAGSKYSSVKLLRQNNIKIKTENRAGKMHMKSIIIDDKYVVLGSMNFSKSGEKFNDENVLKIKNNALCKAFKDQFLLFWREIPDKWLYKNPRAESFDSINSCYDGVDNDFDGKVDMKDEGCNFRLKSQPVKK